MSETALGDLALQIARLEGKLDAYQQTVKLEMTNFERRLDDSLQDRRGIHKDVDSLLTWRAWITGIGSGLGLVVLLLSAYAALHASGAHF